MDLKRVRQLVDLAQMRSDAEMKRFSAFRAHVERMAAQRADCQGRIDAIYRADAPFSVAEARLANAESGRLGRAILQADAEIARLKPGYDAARQRAVREFGRVQVLKQLAEGRTGKG